MDLILLDDHTDTSTTTATATPTLKPATAGDEDALFANHPHTDVDDDDGEEEENDDDPLALLPEQDASTIAAVAAAAAGANGNGNPNSSGMRSILLSNETMTTTTTNAYHYSHNHRNRSQSEVSVALSELDLAFLADNAHNHQQQQQQQQQLQQDSHSLTASMLQSTASQQQMQNRSNLQSQQGSSEAFINGILSHSNSNSQQHLPLLSHSPPDVSASYSERTFGKRVRSGSISGRLRSASDLSDRGLIDGDTKLLLKDIIISGMGCDDELQAALDEYEVSDGRKTSKLEKLIKSGKLNHESLQNSIANNIYLNREKRDDTSNNIGDSSLLDNGDGFQSSSIVTASNHGLDLLNDLDFDFLTVSDGQRDRGYSFLNSNSNTVQPQKANCSGNNNNLSSRGHPKRSTSNSPATQSDDCIGDLDFTNLESLDNNATNGIENNNHQPQQLLFNNDQLLLNNSSGLSKQQQRDRGNSLASWMSSIGDDPLDSSIALHDIKSMSRHDDDHHDDNDNESFMKHLTADLDSSSFRLPEDSDELQRMMRMDHSTSLGGNSLSSNGNPLSSPSPLVQSLSTSQSRPRNSKTIPNHHPSLFSNKNNLNGSNESNDIVGSGRKKRQGRPPKVGSDIPTNGRPSTTEYSKSNGRQSKSNSASHRRSLSPSVQRKAKNGENNDSGRGPTLVRRHSDPTDLTSNNGFFSHLWMNPEDRPDHYIGAYSPEARKARIDRFLDKRKHRVWTKKVKYDVRKNFADSRLRVKGRFVKKEDEMLMRDLMSIT